jgi:methyl-accepting chemotaxis protein
MKKRSSLERKMLTYFGLIAAASLLITMEFVYAIQVATPTPAALTRTPAEALDVAGGVVHSLQSLRNKALLMFVVQAAVTLIVLIMFMRRITGPLQHMVETSKEISDGDLSRTIRIRSKDEIGLLGETINGLASNIQELVALGRSTGDSLQHVLARLRDKAKSQPDLTPDIDELDTRLSGFCDLMGDFTLFPAPPAPGEDHR